MAGGKGRGRPRSKKKSESDDDADLEQPVYVRERGTETSSDAASTLLLYDYVPNEDLGDLVVHPDELIMAKCRGCMTDFGVQEHADMKKFVHHCLRECDAFQMLGIAAMCDVCHRFCMDDASLVKHRTSPSSSCPLLDTDAADVFPAPRTTSIEIVNEPVAGSSRRQPDVITIHDNPVPLDAGRLDAVCYEYLPNTAAGDVVLVSGGSHTIQFCVCKGCHKQFSTLTSREQVAFVNHCITECPEYQKLDIIKYCYPCRLNCMDEDAFMQHILSTESCPAHPYLTFKNNRRAAASSSRTNNRNGQPDTIQLD